MSKEDKNIKEQMELNETPTFAETIKLAVDNGLVAIDPTREEVELPDDLADAMAYGLEAFNKHKETNVKIEKYETKEGSNDKELKDGECVCTCGNHIEKSKVVEIVRAVVDKYNGKVVLAMSEVRDIANAIIAEINK